MESENTHTDKLLYELNRLAETIEKGEFDITLNGESLPQGEADIIQRMNSAVAEYRLLVRQRNSDIKLETVNRLADMLLRSNLGPVIEKFSQNLKTLMMLETQFESKMNPLEESRPTSGKLADKRVPGLDIVKGLERFDGDENVYLKLLRSYVASVRSLLGTVEQIREENLKDYTVTVHGIKGASLDILAEPVGKQAYDLEMAGKSGDINFVHEHNPAFLTAAWQLIHELEAVFAEMESANPKPVKDHLDRSALSQLRSACESYDMDGADEAMTLIDGYHYESDAGLADWLRENVELMNFEEVVAKLSEHLD